MKKATVKLVLDTRRTKKDKTYPIVLRITHNLLTRYITTEYSVTSDDWDDSEQSIKTSSNRFRNVTRVNNHLHTKLLEASDFLTKLNASGEIEGMTVNDIRNQIDSKAETSSVQTFTKKIIEELKLSKKLGNAGVYQQAIDFLDRMTGKKQITFDEINFQLLKSIEAKFLAESNSLNGLSFYLRTVRAIYNRAIKEGKAKRDNYPFTSYSIKETKTQKRAIRKTDMDKIKELDLPEGSRKWHTRNIFLFSFYNRGMNFADIAKLKVSDIENDRIHYNRSKTGRHFSIKLTDSTRTILNYYLEGKEKEELIFPILKRDTLELQMMDLYNERKTFNKYLKEIGNELKIPGNLTSYVARHSWATIAKDLNVPISVISEGLGHEDIKTTQIYLDSFDDEVLDQANQLITG